MCEKCFRSRWEYSSRPHVHLSVAQAECLDRLKTGMAAGDWPMEEAACICGAAPCSSDAYLLARRDRYGLAVGTWLSRRSGILWTSPRFTDLSLNRFYSEGPFQRIYRGPNDRVCWRFAKQIGHGIELREFLQKHLPEFTPAGKTVFDVGCGAGGCLEPFREEGAQVYGCDLGGGKYLEFGRMHGLHLVSGSAGQLAPFGQADLVILSHVLEHSPAPLEMLRQIRGILKPDGLLAIEVPGIKNLASYHSDLMRYLQNSHLFHFSAGTLSATARLAGFTTIATTETVRGLFKPTEDNSEATWDSAEAAEILKYLGGQETSFRLRRMRGRALQAISYSRKVARWIRRRLRQW